jgi:ABC-type multidrug transport system fused ATPase/permease subunit
MEDPSAEIVDISDVIFKMVKPKIRMGVFLKVMENLVILVLSLIPKTFLPQIKKPPELRNNAILIICPIIAGLLTILRYILKEHASRFIGQSGSTTGQTLRALLFDKITRANISFLKVADSSLITKLFLFEFNIITGYVAQVPNLFSFPLIFAFSLIVMVKLISWTTLITFVIFIIAWVLLIFVTKKRALSAMKEKYFSSKRSMVVQEVLSKLKQVKAGKYELYFEMYLKQLRKQEVKAIKRIKDLSSVSNFIMRLTPLFSFLIIMYLEKKVRHKHLDVTTTFTLVGIIGAMKKPLRQFVLILNRYYAYN